MKIESIENVNKNIPNIYIKEECMRAMKALVRNCNVEIGWLALVKKKNNDYIIYDIEVCEQEVTETSTDLHEKGLQSIAERLISTKRGNELNNVRCWCHSHVNMNVSASSQDDETFEEYYKQCGDYFIRLILNKKNEFSLDIADMSSGLIYHGMDLIVIYNEKEMEILKNIENMQSEIKKMNEKLEELTKKEDEEADVAANKIIKEFVKRKTGNYAYGFGSWNNNNYMYNGKEYVRNSDIKEQNNKYKEISDKEEQYDWLTDIVDEIEVRCGSRLKIRIKARNGYDLKYLSEIIPTEDIEMLSECSIAEASDIFSDALYDGIEIFKEYQKEDWENMIDIAREYTKELDTYVS